MLIVPAIDLLGGKCVRLTRGDYGSARVYAGDPVETARALESEGALWIHVVDLDAARGSGNNRGVLHAIRRAVACKIECGGGIRAPQDVADLRRMGLDRLIVGTVLARSPDVAPAMAVLASGALTAGIDADEGRVKVAGWSEESALQDTELARAAAGMGLTGVVYTSIRRDGTLDGPDLGRTNAVAAAGLPVLLSGGIGSAEHVETVHRGRAPGVVGLIVGKAMYERKVDLGQLISKYQVPRDGQVW